jgi:hypothetical protein
MKQNKKMKMRSVFQGWVKSFKETKIKRD